MSMIAKLLCIGTLNVPDELIEEIKTYAFSNITEKVKKVHKIVHKKILAAGKHETEHWIFDTDWDNTEGIYGVQFQAIHCSMCGGYIGSNIENVNTKIRCTCGRYGVF